jgi:MFS transporter, SP family, sugar:H+ symporter
MVNEPANLHARVFFIWGAFCVICAAFVWSMIYETKGLSLEAVDELYGKVPVAWKSKGFQPTVSFQEVGQLAGTDQRRQTLADLEVQVERRKSAVSMTEDYVETKEMKA